MDLRYERVDMKRLAFVAAFVGILAMAGCHSREQYHPPYLSDTSRLVGGGLKIQWEAPEPGTVYLVEKRTGKLVQTFTLETGESYKFAVESIVDADELEQLIGINMDKAQFLLYFKPAEGSGPERPVK